MWLLITGEAGGQWIAVRGQESWMLGQDTGEMATATMTIDQDIAWRLWTKGIFPHEARPQVQVVGHPEVAARVLEMVSIIA